MHTVSSLSKSQKHKLAILVEDEYIDFFSNLPDMVALPPVLDFCTLYASDNFTGVPDHLLGRLIKNEKDVDDKIKLLAAYLRYMKGDKEGIINTFLSIPIFIEEAFRDRVSIKKNDAFPVMNAVNKYITNAIIQWPEYEELRNTIEFKIAINYMLVGIEKRLGMPFNGESLHFSLNPIEKILFLNDIVNKEVVLLLTYLVTEVTKLNNPDFVNILMVRIADNIKKLSLSVYESVLIHHGTFQYPKGCTIQKQNSLKFYSGLLLMVASEDEIDGAIREIEDVQDALAIMEMLTMSPLDILSVTNLPPRVKNIVLPMVA